MTRFLIRRALSGVLVLFLFLTVLFFAVQLILPGDYVSHLSLSMTQRELEQLRLELGLHLPIMQRYLHWMGNVLTGDLGHSYAFRGQGPPVISIMLRVLPATMLVFGLGTALAFLLGQWLGKLTAWTMWRKKGHRKALSDSATFGAIMVYTSFPPWLGFLLLYAFVIRLDIFKTGFNNLLWLEPPYTQPEVMTRMLLALGAIVLVLLLANHLLYRWRRWQIPVLIFLGIAIPAWIGTWALFDWWIYAVDIMMTAALPLLAYVLLSFGEVMLIMQSNMVDTLHDDYVKTAIAKGLTPRKVRSKHAGRNALLPVLSRLVISLPYLLTGAVMIEYTLGWEGVGTTLFYAFGQQDVPMALGMALVIGVVSLGARLLLDVLVALLDPRVRHAGRVGAI